MGSLAALDLHVLEPHLSTLLQLGWRAKEPQELDAFEHSLSDAP